MLYSQTLEDRQLSFFQSLLWHVIQGEQQYINLVNPVIEDASALVKGDKDYFTVDRDNYYIIVYLAENDASYFHHLNADKLKITDYKHINDILTRQHHLAIS